MDYSSCNKKLADECLKFIDLYRDKKENNIYDDFYVSHLNCFENLIEEWKSKLTDCYAVIVGVKGHKNSDGTYSPVYATICKEPHWDGEGIMLTSGFWDATKFNLDCEDLPSLFKYVDSRFKDKCFKIVIVDKCLFGERPRELWSDEDVRGDFDESGEINGNLVVER